MKDGISLLIVTIAIAVMLILVSTASVIGNNAIKSANFEEYVSTLNRVQTLVNEYYVENKELPVINQIVSKESLGNEFMSQVSNNSDLDNNLYVLDISKLNMPTIDMGNGTAATKDVFIVAEDTHNVYYMKGFKYKNVVYYIK